MRALLFFEQSLRGEPEGDLQSVFSHIPPRLPGFFRGLGCQSGCRSGWHALWGLGAHRFQGGREKLRGLVCLIVTRLLHILEQHHFISHDFQVFYCGKQEGPLPQPWERQALLLSSERFSSCKTVCFYNSRFDFKKKIKIFLERHINLLFVYLRTYLQASMRMFCLKSLHRKGKIQGKCCSEALGYRWFQRISQRPSEQAKARLVGGLNLLVRSR